MQRILGTFLVALLLMSLAACGSDESRDETATDPSPSATEPAPSATDLPTSSTEDGPVDFTEVALLSQTAAGGEVSELATLLGDAAAVQQFTAQFDEGALIDQVSRRVDNTDIPDGEVLVAAVISIGCDVPPGVSVTNTEDGLAITALKVESPLQECFAPVTTVALILVDQGAV